MANSQNSGNPNVDVAYRRKKNKEEMKYQVVSFALMIFLTIVAFIAVGYEGIGEWFKVPFILLLACIQVIFQLYYFMHMSHKGHEAPQMFIFTGILITFVTVLALSTIVWW
ncbi:cytochrome c oxidase subunit IVB [Bacillus sp. FJAT-47783]|uniref:cytochrome c oxidase subunit IVB n=1 Tax=Bacillus sp. FJAT-47783 TaxID=2922712 RepID=UPI001FABBFDA|nr:cytochrome c oxidase subunit IVB [Bacillus sp. FJAT-47783]